MEHPQLMVVCLQKLVIFDRFTMVYPTKSGDFLSNFPGIATPRGSISQRQVECPDFWIGDGCPFEIPRPERGAVRVGPAGRCRWKFATGGTTALGWGPTRLLHRMMVALCFDQFSYAQLAFGR